MKKILATIVMSLIAIPIAAQQVLFPSECGSIKNLEAMLTEYEEIPFVRGIGYKNMNGLVIETTMVFFANPNTGTWTFTEKVSDNIYCIVGAGDAFEPVPANIIDGIINRRKGT
jgi:hypothetical protein